MPLGTHSPVLGRLAEVGAVALPPVPAAACSWPAKAPPGGSTPSPHHAELVAPGVSHAHAVRAAGVDASSPECRQALDFGVDG